jgi:hypothetical protein
MLLQVDHNIRQVSPGSQHGEERRAGSPSERAAVQKLAKTLRVESSPKTTLNLLEEVSLSLKDRATRDDLAFVFLRAGPLPGVVCHLSNCAESSCTSDPGVTASDMSDAARSINGASMPVETPNSSNTLLHLRSPDEAVPLASDISDVAGRALSGFVLCESTRVHEEFGAVTGVVAPLIDAFRNRTLALPVRCVAAHALWLIAAVQPQEAMAMAEAGVMQLVVAYYIDLGDVSLAAANMFWPALGLARVLVKSQAVAACQLEEAIRAPEAAQAFAALVVLQVCRNMWSVLVSLCLYCINLLAKMAIPSCTLAKKPPC